MADPVFSLRLYRRDLDQEAVVGLLHELNRHEAGIGARRDLRRQGAVACLEEDSRKAREWGGEQIVALIEGAVVGYIGMALSKAGPFVPAEIRQQVYVENLVVSRDHRRHGIGQALLTRAEDLARLHGLKAICLGVVPGNTAAEAAYAKVGFTPTAIEMRKLID